MILYIGCYYYNYNNACNRGGITGVLVRGDGCEPLRLRCSYYVDTTRYTVLVAACADLTGVGQMVCSTGTNISRKDTACMKIVVAARLRVS